MSRLDPKIALEALLVKDGESLLPEGFPEGLELVQIADTKRVSKHWGEERWLVDEDAPYAYKLIVLKQGSQTSLQYHEFKRESNLLLAGEVTLVSLDGDGNKIETQVKSGAIIHVRPPAVHRLIATTDAVLLEVSTPHLDDVIRLEDDEDRPDGRIEYEHGN